MKEIRAFFSAPARDYALEPITLHRNTLTLLAVLLVAAATALSAMTADQRYVALPASVMIVACVTFLCEVWSREQRFPIFELGSFLVGTTSLYFIVPLIQHLGSGLHFTLLSDYRLMVNNPSPEVFGGFAWNHVVYFVALIVAYLVFRGKPKSAAKTIRLPGRTTLIAALIMYVGFMAWLQFLSIVFGYNSNDTYRNFSQLAQAKASLPYIVVQVTEQARNFTIFLETLLLIYLIRDWNKPAYRLAVFAWTIVKIATIVIAMGDRSPMALFVVTIILLYDRMVKPVNGTYVTSFLVLLLLVLLGYGFVRDVVFKGRQGAASLVSTTNEFMALFSTNYDVYIRSKNGAMDRPPPTFLFSDILSLVPQQISPFLKVDKGQWYMQQIGLGDTGMGFMWGVISSGVVGLGKIDLLIRGLFVGWSAAKIHRWYIAHSTDWRVVVLYVILCLQAYYTVRADTFSVLIFVEYGFFVPLFVLWVIAKFLRGRPAQAVDPTPQGAVAG